MSISLVSLGKQMTSRWPQNFPAITESRQDVPNLHLSFFSLPCRDRCGLRLLSRNFTRDKKGIGTQNCSRPTEKCQVTIYNPVTLYQARYMSMSKYDIQFNSYNPCSGRRLNEFLIINDVIRGMKLLTEVHPELNTSNYMEDY